ncbi:MAG: hypothetical protein WBL85_12105 [Sedimentisphaerales bacterium]
MYKDGFYSSAFGLFEYASGINPTFIAAGGPFETAEGIIDIDVNDGEAILAEVNFAEGVAITEQAKGK